MEEHSFDIKGGGREGSFNTVGGSGEDSGTAAGNEVICFCYSICNQ